MKKYDYHLIVLGGGSAGLSAAAAAANLGIRVALIEKDQMGGDCLNTGCIPSKALIKMSQIYKSKAVDSEAKWRDVLKHINSSIQAIAPHDSKERFESLGVDVYKAHGVLTGPHHVKIDDRILSTKRILIATGSSPFIPVVKGLKNAPFLTNEGIFKIKSQPHHLVVLGGGPIGIEISQAFANLGSKVTLIHRSPTLFKNDEPEVFPIMKEVLASDGVQVKLDTTLEKVMYEDETYQLTLKHHEKIETLTCDALFVATGRVPNTKGMGLETVGVQVNSNGYIITNHHLKTSVSSIYACGDVVGPYLFTHMANYQAVIAIQNALFPFKKRLAYDAVPWTTFTKPEVSHVGITEKKAIESNIKYKSYHIPHRENDRAITDSDTSGFTKIITNHKNIVIGGTIVSEHSSEMLALITLAIKNRLNVKSFLNVTFAYPVKSETLKIVATEALKDQFKPWQKKILRFIMR